MVFDERKENPWKSGENTGKRAAVRREVWAVDIVLTSGYDIAKDAFTKITVCDTPVIQTYQSAYSVALCALEAARQDLLTSDSELVPVYLRASQAERERLEKLKNEENKNQ